MALADNTAAIGDGGTADFVASSASSTPPSSMTTTTTTTTTTTKIGSVSYSRSRAISFQHTNDHQVRKTQPITDDENAKGNAFGHDEEQLQMTMRQSQNNQPEKVLDFVMQEKVASARPPKKNPSAALRRADSADVKHPMVLSQTGKEANARVDDSGAFIASPRPQADLGAAVSTGSCPNSGILSKHQQESLSLSSDDWMSFLKNAQPPMDDSFLNLGIHSTSRAILTTCILFDSSE